MDLLCSLASGMEVSDYFAPAITVIEMAQEASVCKGSDLNGNMENEDVNDPFDTILDD